MSPCSPNDLNLNPIVSPGIPIPGFGIALSPFQIPLPNFDLPTDLLEDLIAFLQKVKLPFPGLIELSPNLDGATKTILDIIAKLFNMLSPFLGIYNFFIALLKIIICIIEVPCAIPNPFAVASKLKKLFSDCIPAFLNLFPFLALIAMIIALLLLILALIEYIIALILAIIDSILRNLKILADGITLQDAQATLAAASKIASIMCFVENILAIFVAIGAILAIIQALSLVGGGAICDDNDPLGCCDASICPPFIKNSPDGINVASGTMIYQKQIGVDVATVLGITPEVAAILNLAPTRIERWQILDSALAPQFPISLIITPILDNVFWPDPLSFDSSLSLKKAPYTVDITNIQVNPNVFGIIDGYGLRTFQIKDCVVVRRPYFGTFSFNNVLDFSNITGTLNIEGGLVFEADGITPFMIGDQQATLNTFIHQEDSLATTTPTIDDSIVFDNVEFVWKPNHPALAGYQLITVGCIPEVNIEKAVQNAVISAEGLGSVSTKLPNTPNGLLVPSTGTLPNVLGTVQCVQTALDAFRADVSTGGAAIFQSTMQTCLGDLRDQTVSTICAAVDAAVSQFKSSLTLDTDVQFTTRPIKVSVILKDGGGNIISTNLPVECSDSLSDKLKGEVTFGEISDFIYDGTQVFNAQITSDIPGTGTVSVSFDNRVFNKVIAATDTTNSSIEENLLGYQFVDAIAEPPVRRDVSDVAADGERR